MTYTVQSIFLLKTIYNKMPFSNASAFVHSKLLIKIAELKPLKTCLRTSIFCQIRERNDKKGCQKSVERAIILSEFCDSKSTKGTFLQ